MYSQRIKNSWRIISLRLVLVIILISIAVAVTSNINNKTTPPKKIPVIAVQTTKKQTIVYDLPVRLKIPKINVDAAIDYTGLTPDGAMDVKKDQDKVAWYSLGPRPGEIGSAVIAGHYGWFGSKGSVFNELQTLKTGDDISIVDEKGQTIDFIVRESQKYSPDANASEVFTSNDNKSHLNLITCNGNWDETKQTYSDRLIVFADKK